MINVIGSLAVVLNDLGISINLQIKFHQMIHADLYGNLLQCPQICCVYIDSSMSCQCLPEKLVGSKPKFAVPCLDCF